MPSAKCATADALPTDALPRSLPAFEAWMRDAGISWDEKLINFGEGAGWGVWAVTDIDEGSLLCTIPKDAIISTRTTSISDILKKEKLGGGLGLTTAVMFEAAIGKKSKWYGYFQSLPKREYLPVFWSAEELDRLKGTELDGQALEDRDAVKEDFETEVEPLADRYGSIIPKENWTLENFSIAASWVASRAFHVDSFHGDALVPLADVFNHKASIVELNDAYAVAKDDMLGGSGDELDEEEDEDEDEDGDEVEGEDEEGEEHSHGEDDESGGGESDSDVEAPVLVALDGGEGKKRELSETEGGCQKHKKQKPGCSDPHCHKTSCGQHEMVDAHGHCATHDHNESELEAGTGQAQDKPVAAEGGGKEMAEGEKMANVVPSGNKNYVRYGVNLRLEIGICDLDKDGVEVLDIVAASSLVKGAEVHNTYGEHGNAELVKKYGFALRRNPFNELSVSKEDILKTSEEAVGKKALSKRVEFLNMHSELLEPDAEPFLVQPGGLINRSLLITLQVLLSSEEDFKKWNDMDDVPAVSFEGEHDDGAVGVGEGGVFEDTFAIPSLSALSQSPSASNTVPGASESGWNTAMGLTLQAALLQRLAEYRSKDAVEGCDDVAAKLAKFRSVWKEDEEKLASGCMSTEADVAQLSALTLSVTEQEAIFEAIDALAPLG